MSAENNDSIPPAHTADASQPRWTEIELLPAWSEEYYDVYTARKLGKWVMLKTLKPEFRDDPKYQEMINKEFEVRYNLSHPNIIMINDFEDVPGVGLSIICDDVYGLSLSQLLKDGKLEDHHYEQLCNRLPMAMEYIQQNHLAHKPLRPSSVIFTENIGNLKLIDVGFDQKNSLSHQDTNDDIRRYGELMEQVLRETGRRDPVMGHVAQRAKNGSFRDVQELQMAISGRKNNRLFIIICAAALGALAVACAWLLHGGA